MTDLGLRSILLGAALLLAIGCERETNPPPDPEPEPETCGPIGERFVDYDWVPADARLLTVIDRQANDLDQALARVRTLSDAAASVGLPIRAALALGQLGMQTQMLALSLAELGLDPGELIELHGPGSELAWLWTTSCDPDLLATRMLARWGVLLRANLDAKLGLGVAGEFPFDVIVLADGRVALTPLGQGSALLRWLRTAEGDEGPGSRLGELAAAPIRAVLQGESLLAGDSASGGSGQAHTRTLRVTGEQIELDGTLWTP
ncbi:hypothetical protein ACNOYE_28685 [Nannocystaceae bacterium ST9]